MPELELDTVFEAEENRFSSEGDSLENNSNSASVQLGKMRTNSFNISAGDAKTRIKVIQETKSEEAEEMSEDFDSHSKVI